jgi:hypothetical protein
MAGRKAKALTVRLRDTPLHAPLLDQLADTWGAAGRVVELAVLGVLVERAGYTMALQQGEVVLVPPRRVTRVAPTRAPVRRPLGSAGRVATPAVDTPRPQASNATSVMPPILAAAPVAQPVVEAAIGAVALSALDLVYANLCNRGGM